MNRHLLLLSFFSVVLIFLFGCNKEKAEGRLLSSFVGNYVMNGQDGGYITTPTYSGDTTIYINNDTISITQIDDSTLMVFGYYVVYRGNSGGAYTFSNYVYSRAVPAVDLSFNSANIKSVNLDISEISSGTSLSGTKVP